MDKDKEHGSSSSSSSSNDLGSRPAGGMQTAELLRDMALSPFDSVTTVFLPSPCASSIPQPLLVSAQMAVKNQ